MAGGSAVSRAERQLADVAGLTGTASLHGTASLQRLHDQLDAVHVTESSPDGGVSVTVGPSGAVTGLTISEPAKAAVSAAELSALVLSTMARAQAKLPAKVAEIALASTGVDAGLTQALTSTYAARFPEVEPDPAPRVAAEVRGIDASDDDYFRENPLR